jgi:hypothetical protein
MGLIYDSRIPGILPKYWDWGMIFSSKRLPEYIKNGAGHGVV